MDGESQSNNAEPVTRLKNANPGWQTWTKLLAPADELDFEFIKNEFLGDYLQSDNRLCFANPNETQWPTWIPSYVTALYGLKADHHEMAGGFAESFYGSMTVKGNVFCEGPSDELLGYPEFDIPDGIYTFQSNSSGALFHLNEDLKVLAPNSEKECLVEMDSLEDFTKRNIEQALKNGNWFSEYEGKLEGTLLD